eukprot:Amastigsp_a4510_91.p3 type:complete len:124 gc:universal Amastigsp_a4510_91:697-326(-)
MRRGCFDRSDDWLQCGGGDVQERHVFRLGPWWPSEHSALLALLLRGHERDRVRGGLFGPSPHWDLDGGAPGHVFRGGAPRRAACCFREQMRRAWSHERRRGFRGSGTLWRSRPPVADFCHQRP